MITLLLGSPRRDVTKELARGRGPVGTRQRNRTESFPLCPHFISLAHCRAVGSPHSVLSPLTMGPEGRGGAPGVSPQGGWKAGRILGLVTSLSNSRFLTSSLTSDTVASDIILFYVNGFPLGLLTFKIPLFTSILLPPIMSHERAVGDVSGEDGKD